VEHFRLDDKRGSIHLTRLFQPNTRIRHNTVNIKNIKTQ